MLPIVRVSAVSAEAGSRSRRTGCLASLALRARARGRLSLLDRNLDLNVARMGALLARTGCCSRRSRLRRRSGG